MPDRVVAPALCPGDPDVLDLVAMARCDRHVIANSSFGFWGAYLGGGETVTPAQWFAPPKINEQQ